MHSYPHNRDNEPSAGSGEGCFTRSLLKAFHEERGLEAVTIDEQQQTISVATIGQADVTKLTARISSDFDQAQNESASRNCQLLAGEPDCSRCDTPLSPAERERVTIHREGDSTTIARVTCPTAPKFWRWRELPFPKVVQRDVEFLEHAEHEEEWKPQLLLAGLCGAFGLAGWILSVRNHPTAGLIGYLAAYLLGGWFPAEEVWERLRKRAIDVHFLMLAVAGGAASIGAWGEGAVLLFLFSLSSALEHYALGRTQKEIRALFREAPKVATVLDQQGREQEIQVEKLRPGMRLLIKPDSQFPTDAEVVKGHTAADESNLTGEAAPVEKAVGDQVLGGTINLWGVIEATVTRPVSESSLQKIIRLIHEAQHQKAPSQQFTDKFSTRYTYFVLALSFVMFFVWWHGVKLPAFQSGDGVRSAFYRTMTLLVVSSPCALVLSIPSAVLAAIAWGARHGVLVRGGAAVEKLAEINVVALDKTGTLTTGELRVEKVESFPAGREREVEQLAYSLERLSTHPLARAITRHGKQAGCKSVDFDTFESVAGQGIRADRNGVSVRLGRKNWALDAAKVPPELSGAEGHEAGLSEIWISCGDLVGRMVMRDDVRPASREVVEELRAAGLRSIVLTGDRQAAAEQLKTELNLSEVRAELKPEEKVAAIKGLNDEGHLVAMVGDGVNDAPSLAVSHVGVAMGARGSDAALEQADIVLMHDRLENFLAAFRLSQRARRIIRQNLVISLGTVAVLVVFALLGRVPLPVGVVGHEGSTVVVVMNSLRLLFGGSARK